MQLNLMNIVLEGDTVAFQNHLSVSPGETGTSFKDRNSAIEAETLIAINIITLSRARPSL
jgi:hypothetical protein